MSGHVKLGAIGALRDYYLKAQGSDSIAWSRGAANPFAGNVNTSGPYDRIDEWNELVLSDYQTGVGRVDPEAGGYLYGETDTRVPEQVILAQGIKILAPHYSITPIRQWALSPGLLDNTYTRTTYALANNNYLAWEIRGEDFSGEDNSFDVSALWVYGECADGTVLRFDIYSDSSNNPNASVGNGSATITNDFPGPHWHKIGVTINNLAGATDYFVVLRPTTGSITLHGVTDLATDVPVRSSSDGSSWSSVTTFHPFFLVSATSEDANGSGTYTYNIVKIVDSDVAGDVYFVGQGTGTLNDNTVLATISSDLDDEVFATTPVRLYDDAGDIPTDAARFLGRVYIARGSGSNMIYFDDAPAVDASVVADHVVSFGGYLWRSVGNKVYYSGDASTWTAVGIAADGIVCDSSYQIRSMAGLNGDMYCACDDGLYRIAPGNFVEGVIPWQPGDDNGRSMCSHAGALYIVVNGRVWRYGQEGSMRDIWVARDDDLPANRLGEVVNVTATDLWVAALVKSTTGRCSVWTYQDEGWHHIATLPTNTAQTMYYDRGTLTLWIGASDGCAFGVYMPVNALNPYNDPDSIYMPAGWIQQDRYKGGQHLLDKAFYSVTVVGDNLSTNVNCKIYWQDEDSTGWELLGTATADQHQLIWPTATRPTGKWIKLGALLQTNDADETPRIRAIVLKFLPIVNDRRQDQMTFTFKSYQQGIDGEPDPYTLEEQRTHFESLVGFDGQHDNFVFLYEDPFGDQMEVTIASHQWSIPVIAYEGGAKVVKEAEVTVVLKQLPDNLYSG